jgi:cytoskeletal protein CcmA (bactofilin family)
MAFFAKGKERDSQTIETEEVVTPKQTSTPEPSGTTISKNIKFEGNISGTDAIHIEGILLGDITVNTVVIGKNGTVTGSITAQKVIISGQVNGAVTCNDLNIMQTGYVTHTVHANTVILSGEIMGNILAENSINITHTGKIKTNSLHSKRITVNGKIEGKVTASELLEVGSNGFVNGEISVKNIKTDEGGRVIGSMAMYSEPQTQKPNNHKKEPKVIDTVIAQ